MSSLLFDLQAQLFGLTIVSFSIDYKVDGEDRHGAIQVAVMDGNVAAAAQGVYGQAVAYGWVPQMIAYIPGDYSMDELNALIDKGGYDFKPCYISGEALREAREQYLNRTKH